MNADYFGPVARPDEETEQAARARHEQLTKPAGSLGRLEELGIWISACQGECPPRDLDDCRVYVFAGDHGVAQGGVSAYPSEVSIQMLANIEAKGAGVNAIADIAGATVTGVDISLDHDAEGPYRIRRSCGSIDREDAMSEEEVDKAIRTGIAIADAAVDEGADLLIAGDLGIGNTTPAAALIGAVTNSEPVVVVGRGTGIDDEGWKLKVAAVRDAMFRVRRLRNDPVEVLRRISSPDMTVMAAFLAQAAVRRTPVILDGVVVTSAALLADQLAPGARDWWVAGHKSAEPAHTLALRHLDKEPLLEYGMRLGEGSGAVAALPLVKSGVSVLRNMATFADAGVSTKD
ncbi:MULTISPECIES: nicotinate-nucleotide--dimethylbenzimidazole phosphoribosyltransferase [Corynebacterium]|uniref:nicotinate-nucleotide--dimethylbenzimidazole phosphoribosyltransferase n=1 Tax=Corynebacterium TaxID=1716 RepID=UPI0008A9C879|nr:MULTISPECIES: nicotinate-nucleotide--dimethylbenzimidazole phosphoribosyltransferase [unclassified Corynebacterium]MBC6763083.1 nicotinate-nucleotide--dimethylbenzimidazole phosphoribosyltransferase [Corynebacterium sp. LK27]OHR35952.1 nicotinate-nucleotide--dimethylbenzimidazole phosphoribosyltransferase [Corynebacterium sp. HMSC074C03]